MSAINIVVVAYLDAQNRQLRIQYLDPTTGDVLANLPQIRLDARDLVDATQIDEEHAIEMVCRLLHYTSSIDGSLKRCWIAATIPESDETPLESASEVEDLYLGGGSGWGAARYLVKSVQGDYLICHTWDGTTEGSTDVYIAKPPELRHSVTAQTVNGVAVSYGSFSISGGVCQRTASASGYTDQIEMVIPQWQLAGTTQDCEIWADTPSGGTGVSVSGTALTLMDTNRGGRAWVQIG